VTILSVATIALGGCSHGKVLDSRTALTRSTSATEASTTTSTQPPTSREAAVTAAYRAHWDAWYAAVQVANADLPAIAATMTGNLLDHTRQELATMRTSGERIKGDSGVPPIESRQTPVVQLQSETAAVLVDCYVDNTARYDAAGHALGDTKPTLFSATATVVLEQGTWKVATLQLRKNGCRA
jgi:hypothetical protein